MTSDGCLYRFQPYADIEHYDCSLLTKVTEHGLMSVNCDPETCPIKKGCTVEIPAALRPLLDYYGKTLRELNERVTTLEGAKDDEPKMPVECEWQYTHRYCGNCGRFSITDRATADICEYSGMFCHPMESECHRWTPATEQQMAERRKTYLRRLEEIEEVHV